MIVKNLGKEASRRRSIGPLDGALSRHRNRYHSTLAGIGDIFCFLIRCARALYVYRFYRGVLGGCFLRVRLGCHPPGRAPPSAIVARPVGVAAWAVTDECAG